MLFGKEEYTYTNFHPSKRQQGARGVNSHQVVCDTSHKKLTCKAFKVCQVLPFLVISGLHSFLPRVSEAPFIFIRGNLREYWWQSALLAAKEKCLYHQHPAHHGHQSFVQLFFLQQAETKTDRFRTIFKTSRNFLPSCLSVFMRYQCLRKTKFEFL